MRLGVIRDLIACSGSKNELPPSAARHGVLLPDTTEYDLRTPTRSQIARTILNQGLEYRQFMRAAMPFLFHLCVQYAI
jgi:hypothetical protein